MTEAVVVAATRSPIGRAGKGSLRDMRPDDLAAAVAARRWTRFPSSTRRRSTTSTSAAPNRTTSTVATWHAGWRCCWAWTPFPAQPSSAGFYDEEITPVTTPDGQVIDKDHCPRAGVTHARVAARIMGTLIHGLASRDKQIGLETMCVGGGQGMAVILERMA
jgi:acetyl-CoA acetyltransferase